jgi:segregation and condensation protein A
VKPEALRAAALRALSAPPVVVVDTDHVAPVRASVRDAVESVLRLLPTNEPMSFRALVAGAPHRLEVIVRFLAVLELYKQGMVDLTQFTNFGELMVRRLADGETALDLASLDDWGEPEAPAAEVDDLDLDDDDDDLPAVPEVVTEESLA